MARILIDGSSTAFGFWSGTEGGWADRLKAAIIGGERTKVAPVVNLATPQRNVEDSIITLEPMMHTMERFSPVRLLLHQPGIIESRFVNGEREMSPERYGEALRKIGEISAKYGFTPVFLGMIPIDEEKTRDMPFRGDHFSYTNRERIRYDGILQDYAGEHGHTYVALESRLSERYPDSQQILDKDGLHFNSLGHAALHEIIYPIVMDELQRQRDEYGL